MPTWRLSISWLLLTFPSLAGMVAVSMPEVSHWENTVEEERRWPDGQICQTLRDKKIRRKVEGIRFFFSLCLKVKHKILGKSHSYQLKGSFLVFLLVYRFKLGPGGHSVTISKIKTGSQDCKTGLFILHNSFMSCTLLVFPPSGDIIFCFFRRQMQKTRQHRVDMQWSSRKQLNLSSSSYHHQSQETPLHIPVAFNSPV